MNSINTFPALDDEELKATGNPVGCFMVFMGTKPSNVEYKRQMNIYEDRRPVTPTQLPTRRASRLKRLSVSLGLSDLPALQRQPSPPQPQPLKPAPDALPDDIPPEKAQAILANRRRRLSHQQSVKRRQSSVATLVPGEITPTKVRAENPVEHQRAEIARRKRHSISVAPHSFSMNDVPTMRTALATTPPAVAEEGPEPLSTTEEMGPSPIEPVVEVIELEPSTTEQIATVPGILPTIKIDPLPPRRSSRMFEKPKQPPAKKIRPGSLSRRSFVFEDLVKAELEQQKRATIAFGGGCEEWDISKLGIPTETQEEEADDGLDPTERALRRLEGRGSEESVKLDGVELPHIKPQVRERPAPIIPLKVTNRKSLAFRSASSPTQTQPSPPREISIVLAPSLSPAIVAPTRQISAMSGTTVAVESPTRARRRESETVRIKTMALYGTPEIALHRYDVAAPSPTVASSKPTARSPTNGVSNETTKRKKAYRRSLAMFSRNWSDDQALPSGHTRLASVAVVSGNTKPGAGGKKEKVSRLKRISIQIGRLFH